MSKLLDKARGIVFDDEDDEPAGASVGEVSGDARAETVGDGGSGGGALPFRTVPASAPVARASLREASQLPNSATERPRTAIGAITASIAIGRGVEAENKALKERVRELEDATVVEFLDPRTIRASRFANRHETAFSGAEFAALKAEIASAGRNVQPIKVRRIASSSAPASAQPASDDAGVAQRYELAFGHRRHRACLELGIPVAAIVESMTDPQLFAEMERENRERQNLSAWEQGTMYRRALDAGLFPSLRRLATAIGAQPGNVSAALQLAALPEEVVEAFGTPLALQYRWAAPLKAALDADVQGVRDRAKAIALLHPRPSPRDIMQRLTAPESTVAPTLAVKQSLVLTHRGRVVGNWERDDRGDVTCRVRAAGLNPARERRLLDAIARLFEISEADPGSAPKR